MHNTPTHSNSRGSDDSLTEKVVTTSRVQGICESSGANLMTSGAGNDSDSAEKGLSRGSLTITNAEDENEDTKEAGTKEGEKGLTNQVITLPKQQVQWDTFSRYKTQFAWSQNRHIHTFPIPHPKVIIIFASLSLAALLSFLDQTIVSTILPQISLSLPGSVDASWIGTAYLLTSTCFQPLYGRFSDIFGRKTMLLFALTIFVAASGWCGAAKGRLELVVARGVKGVGGGGIINLVMIIVSDVVSLRERGMYQGILGGVVAVANAIGPPVGGVISERLGWRWGFWINLPLGAVVLLVVIFALPLVQVKGRAGEKLKVRCGDGSNGRFFGQGRMILMLCFFLFDRRRWTGWVLLLFWQHLCASL